jgi:glutaminyl-tRNA synthetase
LWIEAEDFSENPPPKYHRLAPGRTVRLRYSYLVTCNSVVKDDQGNVIELRCSYHPTSLDADATDLPKAKAAIHWVSAAQAIAVEARLYDRLFTVEDPTNDRESRDWRTYLNPDSLQVLKGCRAEPALRTALPGTLFQFERIGYFCVDPDSKPEQMVFNRTVTLKDTWAKVVRKNLKSGIGKQ